jgi:hypothetical protein
MGGMLLKYNIRRITLAHTILLVGPVVLIFNSFTEKICVIFEMLFNNRKCD